MTNQVALTLKPLQCRSWALIGLHSPVSLARSACFMCVDVRAGNNVLEWVAGLLSEYHRVPRTFFSLERVSNNITCLKKDVSLASAKLVRGPPRPNVHEKCHFTVRLTSLINFAVDTLDSSRSSVVLALDPQQPYVIMRSSCRLIYF